MKKIEQFKTGTVHANGIRFSFIERGVGPLVLCLHGFPDHARSFRHQLCELSKRGFRVVAPNMRGYAPTDIPSNGPYQTAALGQDVVSLIDALSYESTVVIGHDWGAAAAYGAAIIAPEKISRLIVVAVPYGKALRQAWVRDPEQQRKSWYIFFFQTPIAEQAVAFNNFAFIDRLWRDWAASGWACPKEEMDALKKTLAIPGVLTAALDYYRNLFDTTRHLPSLENLQHRIGNEVIQVPTLYVHGKLDGCIRVNLSEGMERYFPDGLSRIIIPKAGHFVHQEKPDEFNRIVLEFLRE